MASRRKTGPSPLKVLGIRQPGVVALNVGGQTIVITFDDLSDLVGTDKVVGPNSSTDKALVRWDGVNGRLVQDGQVLEEDDGRLTTLTDPTGPQDAATKAYVDAQITAGVAGAGGHLHGLQRVLGDGATTAFNLLDFAEYLLFVSDNGLIVDPTLYALSATRDQVEFTTAPTAAHVLVFSYVIANS